LKQIKAVDSNCPPEMRKAFHLPLSGCLLIMIALSFSWLAAAPVSLAEAVSAAQTWWRWRQPERAGLRVQSSQAVERDGQALIYVLNSQEGGFVLLSADTECPPILAYSASGRFDLPVASPAVAEWLSGSADQVQTMKEQQVTLPANRELWLKLLAPDQPPPRLNRDIPPLLTTTWDQGFPYNSACPVDASSPAGGHAWAGCGAAALAQLMRYWGYPEHGTGSRSYQSSLYGTITANFGTATYNWDNMPAACPPDNSEIPQLLYHSAVALGTNFGPDVSTFMTYYFPVALGQYFDYDLPELRYRVSYPDAEWKAMIRADLDLFRPVVYIAAYSAVSHLFILDGYDNQDLFHINWCWGGDYDGYYYLETLDPGGVLYHSGHAAVFNIHPELDIPVHPLGFSATLVSNYRIDLNWQDVANNEDGFIIQRKTGEEGDWAQIAVLPANSTSYSDLDLASHTSYHYRAKTFNSSGNSSLSNEVYTITAGIIAPVQAEISCLENGQALLSWAPSTNAAMYRIYHSDLTGPPESQDWSVLGETSGLSLALDASQPRRFYYVSALSEVELPQNFVEVTGGTFSNGTSTVTLSTFYLDKYEVTQSSYLYVMGTNPSDFQDDPTRPVGRVSWFKAIEYCNRRSLLESLTPCYSYGSYGTDPDDWPAGWSDTAANHSLISCNWTSGGYRLPTEMEWMFAARGGNLCQGYTYSGSNDVAEVAWYYANSGMTTHPVGSKPSNEIDLYDLSGNAFEWVWDVYAAYPSTPQTNPHGPASGTNRVRRGGGYNSGESYCATAYRGSASPTSSLGYSGFRVCRIIPRQKSR